MKPELLVVGSVAFDTIETRAGKREEILGGAATFISLAASHFCPVNLVAVVGKDDFPDKHVQLLESKGVDVRGLERAPGKTFRWSGVYAEDFSSRTTLDTQLGVFETFDPKIPPEYLESRYVLLGNIHPGLQLKVLDKLSEESYVAADTMNLWIDTTPDELGEVIRRVNLLIINDEEAMMLTGERQIIRAALQILDQGPESLIIKRGEHGAYLFTKDSVFFAPAILLPEVVDPTGAGDTFAAGLLGHLTGQDSVTTTTIKTGMIYGAASASLTVEGFGVDKLTTLSRKALEKRFQDLRDLVSI